MNWPDLLQSLRSPLGFHEKGKLYLSRKCLQTPGKVKETNSPGFHFCPTLSSLPCPSCTTDQALSTSLALLLGSIFSWLPRWLTGDKDSVPGLGRCPGGGNGNPLQYSCLDRGKNFPMDRGAWWATVHGVTKRHNWTCTHANHYIKSQDTINYITLSHRLIPYIYTYIQILSKLLAN